MNPPVVLMDAMEEVSQCGQRLLGNQEWLGGSLNSLSFARIEKEGAERGRENLWFECYSFIHFLTHGYLLNPSCYLSGSIK